MYSATSLLPCLPKMQKSRNGSQRLLPKPRGNLLQVFEKMVGTWGLEPQMVGTWGLEPQTSTVSR